MEKVTERRSCMSCGKSFTTLAGKFGTTTCSLECATNAAVKVSIEERADEELERALAVQAELYSHIVQVDGQEHDRYRVQCLACDQTSDREITIEHEQECPVRGVSNTALLMLSLFKLMTCPIQDLVDMMEASQGLMLANNPVAHSALSYWREHILEEAARRMPASI